MKALLSGVFASLAVTVFAADAPSFENFSGFQIPPEAGVVWAAATNTSPAALWIYKVFPQKFSVSTISNLMALGSFSWQDERRKHQNISSTNDAPLLFSNRDRTRTLTIVPDQGWIKYHDEYAPANHWDGINHLWQTVEKLPGENDIEGLALNALAPLGVSRFDLATRPASPRLLSFGEKRTRSYFDRRDGKYKEDEVILRGIYFVRKIDGVNFAGTGVAGGSRIDFGNHAKIAELEIVWRNLQPYEHRKIAGPGEIVRYIHEGKAVMTHRDNVNPTEVKKITITEVTPFYMGKRGEETQDFVYPFAQLEAIADLGTTNSPVQLYCPILSQTRLREEE